MEQPSNPGLSPERRGRGGSARPREKQGSLVSHRRCRPCKEREMEDPMGMEIVRRAYELWEQAGMPEGMEQEFYRQAEQELRDADKSSPDDL